MAGGLLGAMVKAKARKQRTLERQEREKARPRNRPGRADGTLGAADCALRLMPYNNGADSHAFCQFGPLKTKRIVTQG